jgi:hypothetical protein
MLQRLPPLSGLFLTGLLETTAAGRKSSFATTSSKNTGSIPQTGFDRAWKAHLAFGIEA